MTNTKRIVGIGFLAAGAAAAAYAFTGERGMRNRQKLAIWAKRMKADVFAKLKELEAINEEKYHAVVDGVKARYQAMRNLDPQEVALFAMQLKKHWSAVKQDISTMTPPKKKTAKTKKKKTAAK
jgi:hypothetical protein